MNISYSWDLLLAMGMWSRVSRHTCFNDELSWPMDSKFQATWFQANIDFLSLLSFLLFRFVYYLFLDFGIVFCQQQDQDRWQNARWKNHEMISWRDIKLQWWASISCFPFDLGFCIWFDNHFDHHWIVLEGTCGRALEGGITRQQLKWDEGEGCGHKVY